MSEKMNVMLVGAAGGIGRTLSLLLTASGSVKKLVLCDIVSTEGIKMELSHISNECEIKIQNETNCDNDLDMVLMPCGKPQNSKDEKRDDLLKINAGIFKNLVTKISERQTKIPIIVIIGNPVNSLVVICAEALKKIGKFDHKKLIGFNELDETRAKHMVAKAANLDSDIVDVPVIGGHSEKTIFPVLDEIRNLKTGEKIELDEKNKTKLFQDIRQAGDRVLKAYDNRGTAILSTAYATMNLVKHMYNQDGSVHSAFIKHELSSEYGLPQYMTVRVKYCREGISEILPLDSLINKIGNKSDLLTEVSKNIAEALKFV